MPNGNKKVVIGVTGTIGAGKTTVSRIFEEFGADYISADEVGWQVLPDITEELEKRFGSSIMDGDKIDKKKLRKLVFSDRKALDYLNSLSHPLLIKKIIEYVEKSDDEVVVIDAALLFDWEEILQLVDYSVLVVADKELKRERSLKRGFSRDAFERILGCQRDEKEMRKRARFIIKNNSTVEDLKAQCLKIYKEIKNDYRMQ
ncbi:MAG TPA: dephospho-CoA kinase [candidate division WOR-3 bacterium]|uniref:Dephospho-CoA kinase n=1 Tax=candidate division WOR-3 bacterium TaxID=2052148 RepID=A0A9C9K0L6_UNCW3|nr:dephospho-CoA kinase [candidate division WOR-3 bacterium]